MTPKQSTPAATLEHQVAADSGLEELPHFDEPSNGHILEGGIRPSERCGTPSELGIGCTFRDEHPGAHSWQPADDLAVERSQQPVLPGTPEPEQNDWSVPSEASFKGKDFQTSSGLRAIGERLIEEKPTLAHLVDVEIRYLWKRRGGSSGGNPKLGALQRPGGLLKYFTGGVTFIAWLAADNCRELQLPPEKIEANLFHQLLHADTNPDDDDAYRIRGHDFEGFVDELDGYGPWSADFREMHAHVAKLPLEQAIDDATVADEGEESE